MTDYFLSDVHLRIDRPERGRRLAAFIDRLGPSDRLVIVGDLCDFWFASRQRRGDPMRCIGLRSVAEFRARGGDLTLMLGNHDGSLGPFYEGIFGVPITGEPLTLTSHGRRLHLAHGHCLGSTARWKKGMESPLFLAGFALLPEGVARGLKTVLNLSNDRTRAEADRRHLATYRRAASALADTADLVVLGHIHHALDDADSWPRLVILGDWKHGSSYLRSDESGATLILDPPED